MKTTLLKPKVFEAAVAFSFWTHFVAGQGNSTPFQTTPPARPALAALESQTYPEYPLPVDTVSQEIVSLDRGWLFGGKFVEGSEQPDYDDSNFLRVTIPHVVTPLGWNNFSWAAWEYEWIYRRHFDLPRSTENMRVYVDFDGVMTGATPSINAVTLPQHLGGYLPFSYEITDHINKTDNVLAVRVDSRWLNVPPDGSPAGPEAIDYLEPGGIYRSVRLRMVPRTFIADLFIKPLNVLESYVSLEVETTIEAGIASNEDANLTVALMDGERILNETTTHLKFNHTGLNSTYLRFPPGAAIELWSPSNPKLYNVMASLYVAGQPVHTFNRTTGFRDAVFKVDGFYLNGQRFKIFGLDRHQLYPYGGMSIPTRLQRRDAEILKDLNCNMVRGSHYPQSPDFLDACDELGIMVWEETPGWQYIGNETWQEHVVENVHDMVLRDRSRPSVILWAVQVNESPRKPDLYVKTRNVAKGLDGSRQTAGSVGLFSEAPGQVRTLTDYVQDVYAYDDYHAENGNATLLDPMPLIPYLVTESVGGPGLPSMYRFLDTQYALQTQSRAHAQVHDVANSKNTYAGALSWLAFDYDSSFSNQFENIASAGVADTFRVYKPGATYYQSQRHPREGALILPAFFWDFGTVSSVLSLGKTAMIWSNCDRLEAYVAGQHYQTMLPAGGFPNTAYPPFYLDVTRLNANLTPPLRLDGYVSGHLVASKSFSGSTAGDRLQISLDDPQLMADGIDASLVTFRVVDRFGAPRPYTTGNVHISIEGPGTWVGQLIALDVNAKRTTDTSSTITVTLTNGAFPLGANGGVGGAVIRTLPDQPGIITVHASHAQFGDAQVQIEAVQSPDQSPASGPKGILSTGPPELTELELTMSSTNWTLLGNSSSSFDIVKPGASATKTFYATLKNQAAGSILDAYVLASFNINGQPSKAQVNSSLTLQSGMSVIEEGPGTANSTLYF